VTVWKAAEAVCKAIAARVCLAVDFESYGRVGPAFGRRAAGSVTTTSMGIGSFLCGFGWAPQAFWKYVNKLDVNAAARGLDGRKSQ
jgi:hypothetical protein